ncbi:TnsA endonuclease N-terminal domain-containing protein [Paenibacillus sp. BJ-4]|uniref:TnsA endonuclease N-terminal domain-containing protein n=1 Tax=Paenibacillus sp. BJ-4 TaxID=2878097 RepID=UPI001CF0A592|nr:TnsA endonuclease N-terminal domain-containing protein [Paenibacillus sp. BJ-4]
MTYKPAREIKPKHYGYRGKEPFFKNGSMVHWDSFLERNFIRLADFDPNVEELYHQPVCIHYMTGGKQLRYYPDFKMILNNNQTVIVEVKPEAFLNHPKNLIKYEVGKKYCEERGWLYQVYTEIEINPSYLQWNLSLLRHLGTQDFNDKYSDYILEQLQKKTESAMIHLRKDCHLIDEQVFYSNLYNLIYLQEIKVDLVKEKLNDYSILRMV